MDEIFLCLFDNKHYDFIHHTRICLVFDFNLCRGKVGVRLPFMGIARKTQSFRFGI